MKTNSVLLYHDNHDDMMFNIFVSDLNEGLDCDVGDEEE